MTFDAEFAHELVKRSERVGGEDVDMQMFAAQAWRDGVDQRPAVGERPVVGRAGGSSASGARSGMSRLMGTTVAA